VGLEKPAAVWYDGRKELTMQIIGRLESGDCVVIMTADEYDQRQKLSVDKEPRDKIDYHRRWEQSEVGRIFKRTKGTIAGSKGQQLMICFLVTQWPEEFLSDWNRWKWRDIDFVFDGTIASYKAIRPRLCEVPSIGPKLAALYDEIILGGLE
jgi:hypothetical protein